MREDLSTCRKPTLDRASIRQLRHILFVFLRYCRAPNSLPSVGRSMASGALINAKISGVLTDRQYHRLKLLNFAWYDYRSKQVLIEEEEKIRDILKGTLSK